MEFTDLPPDSVREILLKLQGPKLFTACSVNKYINSLCTNEFWKQKFIQEYGPLGPPDLHINYQKAYKEIYTKTIYQQFLWAAKNGYTDFLKILLKYGNLFDLDEALIEAVKYGHIETAKFLLDTGAYIHVYYNETLTTVISSGNYDIFKALVNYMDKESYLFNEALLTASEYGQTKIVELLLENGANVHYSNDRSLIYAAEGGHVKTVLLLLEYGVDNQHKVFAAILRSGNFDMIKLILDWMKSKRYELSFLDEIIDENFNLLASKGYISIIKLLIDYRGINRNLDEALIKAVFGNHLETTKLLLDLGANIHINDDESIRIAAGEGNTELVNLLLDYGADINANNGEPLKIAYDYDHYDTVKLLLKRGAHQ